MLYFPIDLFGEYSARGTKRSLVPGGLRSHKFKIGYCTQSTIYLEALGRS